MNNNMLISEVKNQFLEYSEVVKGFSRCTIDTYKWSLGVFENYMGDTQIEDLNLHNVIQFRVHINRLRNRYGDGVSLKSQREHIVALRSLLKYCALNDIKTLSKEKVDVPKVPPAIVTFLTADEVKTMLRVARGSSISELRNRAILEVLYSTGMRISELLSVNRNQIDLTTREFSVIGKGKKIRLVFLSNQASVAVMKYLSVRKDKHKPLFIDHSSNSEGGRFTKRSAAKMVKVIAEKAGITKTVTCHTFRHSFATDLLVNGADMRSIQTLLGHASIRTTQIYTHITDTHLKNVFNKYHNKNETFLRDETL